MFVLWWNNKENWKSSDNFLPFNHLDTKDMIENIIKNTDSLQVAT